jgi:hypothetical protein
MNTLLMTIKNANLALAFFHGVGRPGCTGILGVSHRSGNNHQDHPGHQHTGDSNSGMGHARRPKLSMAIARSLVPGSVSGLVWLCHPRPLRRRPTQTGHRIRAVFCNQPGVGICIGKVASSSTSAGHV